MQTPAALTLQLFEKMRIDLQVINKTVDSSAEPSSYLIGAATNGAIAILPLAVLLADVRDY